jgi:hypothetical protein
VEVQKCEKCEGAGILGYEKRDSHALLKRHSAKETLQDHQVVGQKAEDGFSVLAVIRTGRQRRTQKAFDHRKDRFNLLFLAVGLFGKTPGQRSGRSGRFPFSAGRGA